MLYLLHHSKGALVLSADDREQVVKWSKRQLGHQAPKSSVIESNPDEHDDMVERSGTGMWAKSAKGCRPVASISADLTQCTKSNYQEQIVFSNALIEQQRFAREAIWH